MTRPDTSTASFLRTWLIWTAATLVFPLAGLAGTAVAGRVDSALPALTGGAVVGLIIGSGQAVLSRRRLDPRRWIPATTVGMGLGLFLGAAAVDYSTSLTDLMLMGAITGLLLGAAQTAALPRRTRSRWVWAAAMPVVWALGWAATTLIGVNVDEQFTIVGLSGALTVSALSGLLLHQLLPYRTAAGPRPASTPIEATA
jgi:hypothetical protein